MCLPAMSFAGDETSKKKFEGEPIVTLFANYHAGVSGAEDGSGFGLDRAYLGYEFEMGEEWEGKIVLDAGSTKISYSALDFVMYVKNAYVSWEKYGFEIDFGLIKTSNFSEQESFWGHRYIMKVFSDEYGIAPSADFGVNVEYEFADWLSVDVAFTNGEGYKKLDLDNNYRYGAGIAVEPFDDFEIRAYYDLYTSAESGPGKGSQNVFSIFAGYEADHFNIGAEYYYASNYGHLKNNELHGMSAFATVDILDNLNIFARYDGFFKGDEEIEGNYIRAGLEYRPIKQLAVSPNAYICSRHGFKPSVYVYLNVLFDL